MFPYEDIRRLSRHERVPYASLHRTLMCGTVYVNELGKIHPSRVEAIHRIEDHEIVLNVKGKIPLRRDASATLVN